MAPEATWAARSSQGMVSSWTWPMVSVGPPPAPSDDSPPEPAKAKAVDTPSVASTISSASRRSASFSSKERLPRART